MSQENVLTAEERKAVLRAVRAWDGSKPLSLVIRGFARETSVKKFVDTCDQRNKRPNHPETNLTEELAFWNRAIVEVTFTLEPDEVILCASCASEFKGKKEYPTLPPYPTAAVTPPG